MTFKSLHIANITTYSFVLNTIILFVFFLSIKKMQTTYSQQL